ncbi:MAG: ATP-binding protein [Acidobacteriota bacterium]
MLDDTPHAPLERASTTVPRATDPGLWSYDPHQDILYVDAGTWRMAGHPEALPPSDRPVAEDTDRSAASRTAQPTRLAHAEAGGHASGRVTSLDSWLMYTHASDRPRFLHSLRSFVQPSAARATRSSPADRWTHERRVLHRDGSIHHLRSTAVAIRNRRGILAHVLGYDIDISQQPLEKRQQQIDHRLLERQKLESLGALAGGIAHDFNNLLMGVVGHADLLLEEIEPGTISHLHVEAIQRASERATELARQMLAYSGRGQFIIKPIDLHSLIAEMMPLLEATVPRRIVLKRPFAEQGPALPQIEADVDQLRQIILNLMTNAVEALEQCAGLIELQLEQRYLSREALDQMLLGDRVEPGVYVMLEVTDTGCGMSDRTLSRMFDPFFSTKFVGRGLGLAAVLGIVRGHKGAIDVVSTVDIGTTVRIYFPQRSGASTR